MLKLRISAVENIEWLFILIILFGQFMLSNYSVVSNLFLLNIYIIQLSKQKGILQKYNITLILVMSILFIYSLLLENEPTYAIRFAIIILFILSAYSWKIDYMFFLKAIFVVSLIQVIGLMLLEAYMFTISEAEYSYIRNEVVKANNMGDVFNYNNIYYKLELRGTSLVVFMYMLSYAVDVFPNRYKKFYRFLYLIGLIIAGNFAYQLIAIIFHLVWYVFSNRTDVKSITRKTIRMLFFLFLFGGILWTFVSDTFQAKEDGGSIPTRYDQAKVLYKDATRSELIFLFGSGLGHTLEEKTLVRDYRDKVYFEVQTLYVANQLGLIGFTFLLLANVVMALRSFRYRKLIMIYMFYAIYAFSNPYMWDTTHILVIVSILCGKYIEDERKNLVCTSPIQAVH